MPRETIGAPKVYRKKEKVLRVLTVTMLLYNCFTIAVGGLDETLADKGGILQSVSSPSVHKFTFRNSFRILITFLIDKLQWGFSPKRLFNLTLLCQFA